MYDIGSTELLGLTFHFLNKLNNDYPKTVWFTGHSHYSWKNIAYNNTGDIHFCNEDHPYIAPTASDNTSMTYNNSNWFAPSSGNKIYNRES